MENLKYIIIGFVLCVAGGVAAIDADMRGIEDRAELGDFKAIKALRDSAEVGNTRAMNFLGYLYWQGKGARLNRDSALFFLRKGALLKDSKAMANLGHLMLIGSAELKPDTTAALQLLDEAAGKRNISALRELDDFFQHNLKFDKTCPSGIKKIADAYSHGYPFPYDYNKSINLYNRAAEAGDSASIRIIDELLQLFPDKLKN